ncbi:hypothetical protein HK104_003100, partial [Borealophlyctis nickersoniae]
MDNRAPLGDYVKTSSVKTESKLPKLRIPVSSSLQDPVPPYVTADCARLKITYKVSSSPTSTSYVNLDTEEKLKPIAEAFGVSVDLFRSATWAKSTYQVFLISMLKKEESTVFIDVDEDKTNLPQPIVADRPFNCTTNPTDKHKDLGCQTPYHAYPTTPRYPRYHPYPTTPRYPRACKYPRPSRALATADLDSGTDSDSDTDIGTGELQLATNLSVNTPLDTFTSKQDQTKGASVNTFNNLNTPAEQDPSFYQQIKDVSVNLVSTSVAEVAMEDDSTSPL